MPSRNKGLEPNQQPYLRKSNSTAAERKSEQRFKECRDQLETDVVKSFAIEVLCHGELLDRC